MLRKSMLNHQEKLNAIFPQAKVRVEKKAAHFQSSQKPRFAPKFTREISSLEASKLESLASESFLSMDNIFGYPRGGILSGQNSLQNLNFQIRISVDYRILRNLTHQNF